MPFRTQLMNIFWCVMQMSFQALIILQSIYKFLLQKTKTNILLTPLLRLDLGKRKKNNKQTGKTTMLPQIQGALMTSDKHNKAIMFMVMRNQLGVGRWPEASSGLVSTVCWLIPPPDFSLFCGVITASAQITAALQALISWTYTVCCCRGWLMLLGSLVGCLLYTVRGNSQIYYNRTDASYKGFRQKIKTLDHKCLMTVW